ncbi:MULTISPECIES: restriction endonuclease subunit S [unclassified Psychrobacter]|uniref:restriction endonuclease subunit S n=1 Tax=unclassified Psychrobacter TaxID=196806 RepID=UPI00071E6DB6|nr:MULTISPECIES: restriction endonuclease subunit S [unclassified Psychrobacter]OLF38121.1 restriction endonuclease subunit S [Psychrobacter sp. Cmf 22.2]
MASDWEVVSLVDHCKKIGSGATPRGGSSVYLEEGEITLIRSQNIYNDGFKKDGLVFITAEAAGKLKNVIVEENDILLNITGDSVARVCMVDNQVLPARVNQHVSIIRPKESSFNPLYLRYQLVSPQVQQLLLNYASAGATRHALTKSMIENLGIPKPDLDTQNNIAHILGSLDDKIELNRQMNETLEAMAQALFKSWFVDFDPVIDNALAAGNAIPDVFAKRAEQRQAIEKKENSNIQNLFPDEFEFTEEMGWIPKGWESGTLADICFFGKGKINTSELSLENYVSTENMNKEKAGISYAASIASTSQVPKFSVGQTLISNIRPYFKKIWLASFSGGRSNDVLGFQANDAVANEYLFSLLYQDSFFDYMTATSKGTKMPRGDKAAIMSWSVAIPPLILMEEFSNKVKPMYLANNIRSKQAISLSELRDTLLPKLMSGELRVSAAAMLEDA